MSFRTSSKAFYEAGLYNCCLDVLRDLAEIRPWESADNGVLDAALERSPNHLPREWTVRFAIFRDSWNAISIRDLQNSNLANDFREYRNEPRLKEKIRQCEEVDRSLLKLSLPLFVADYCLEQRRYVDALELFVSARNEVESAIKATTSAISSAQKNEGDILRVVHAWERYERDQDTTVKEPKIKALLSLFRNPREASEKGAARLLNLFGHDMVRLAVKESGMETTILHSFDRNTFKDEVEKALTEQYDSIGVVGWYLEHDDRVNAISFTETNLATFGNDELLRDILGRFSLRPEGIAAEIQRRGALVDAVRTCLEPNNWDHKMAEKLSNMALASLHAASTSAGELFLVWQPHLGDNRVKRLIAQTTGTSSKIVLLLKVNSKMRASGTRFQTQESFLTSICFSCVP